MRACLASCFVLIGLTLAGCADEGLPPDAARASELQVEPFRDPLPADVAPHRDTPPAAGAPSAPRAAQRAEMAPVDASGSPVLAHCMVSVKNEVQLPAEEPGLLLTIDVQEGSRVTAGQRLAQIDDRERKMQKQLALIEQAKAREEAENDVNIRYSIAAADVALAEYDQAVSANRKVPGTFPQAELRRLNLTEERARLQVEQAQFDLMLASFAVKARAAELEATEMNIVRRQIVTNIDGEVVEVFKHAGEWVQAGETVIRVVDFGTLRVEGFLNASQFDPGEVVGRPVTVEVVRARGRTASVQGRIVYVNQLLQAGGDYVVRAEIENQRDGAQWLLQPGLQVSMTIHVN